MHCNDTRMSCLSTIQTRASWQRDPDNQLSSGLGYHQFGPTKIEEKLKLTMIVNKTRITAKKWGGYANSKLAMDYSS